VKSSAKKIALWTVVGLAVLGAAAAIGFWVPSLLRASVDRKLIRTAVVELGDITAGINADGKAVSENEQVLPSLLDARILRVLKHTGDRISPGEPIAQLDAGAVQADLEKARQDLAEKQKELAGIRQQLDQTLSGLRSQLEIKRAEVARLHEKVEQRRSQFKDGIVSANDVRNAEAEEEKAQADLRNVEESRRNAESTAKAHSEQLTMEAEAIQTQRSAGERDMASAIIRSDNEGVLTWVADEGSTVARGDPVARIADTRSFRVEADLPDAAAGPLKFGMPVTVTVGTAVLQGNLTGIAPATGNGVVTVKVTLQDSSNPVLRPDLRVNVLVPTERKSGVLLIQAGPALAANSTREVFVIRGGIAIKVPVTLGIASAGRCEVVQGLKQGDEVILSDMSRFMNLNQVAVR